MHDKFKFWHMYADNNNNENLPRNNFHNTEPYAKLGALIFEHDKCQNCKNLRKQHFRISNHKSSTATAKMNLRSYAIIEPLQTSITIKSTPASIAFAGITNGSGWLTSGDNDASPASIDTDDEFSHASSIVAGNLSYFAPAISHVILAPTTRTSMVVASATSLHQDLIPAVVVANSTTTNAGASGSAGGGGIGTEGATDNLNSFYFYETEQFAVLWILFTIIVLGNSAVLFVMFMNKNRKSRMNYFIKQLAIADLCVGLLHVLTDIVWRITISWRAGNIACKVIRFSQVCVTYSSTYVLVAMSIDRYDAITHPMNFSKSWKRARHLVAAAWIISAIFSLPILLLYEEKLIQGQTQCWIELGSPWAWQLYMCLVSASLFAIPALIITACYAIIVKTIWAKGSIFVPAERAGYANPATRRASSRGIIPRAKVKTIKMTFVIVIVFIVCWSPYIIFDLLQVFGKIPQTQTNIAIATFIQSLAPLNSAANPLIYCIFSSQVFRTLSRFPPFKWFTCCCESYRQNSAQNRCTTVGRRLHNSCDSMRTLTTSLTVSRRSNKAAARVIICERPPKVALASSAV